MTLQRSILEVLNRVHPRQMPVEALFGDVQINTAELVTRTDFNADLNRLEAQQQIAIYTTEDTTRVALTTQGLHRIAHG